MVAGESWWETDLLAVAKEYLANVPAADGSGSSLSATPLPPLGVREWLVQEQVRSWLVAIFSRADPLRLMEVDLVMQIGKVRTGRCSACIAGTRHVLVLRLGSRWDIWCVLRQQRYDVAAENRFHTGSLLLFVSIDRLGLVPSSWTFHPPLASIPGHNVAEKRHGRRTDHILVERLRLSRPQADFKDMLKALVSRYGLKEFDFLRKASSHKLEALGVSSLIPSEGELNKGSDATPSPSPPEHNGSQVSQLALCHRAGGGAGRVATEILNAEGSPLRWGG